MTYSLDPRGGEALAMKETDGDTPAEQAVTIFYVTDHLGSVVVLLDNDGEQIGGYSYDSYGQAADAGVASMLAFQLYVEGSNLGALNLYSSEVEAFTAESEHIGLTLASHAAIALAEAQKADQLHQAVESRDVIGQAKGILMERYKITGHQAFLLLAKASSDTNQKLHTIADILINTGEVSDEN